MIRTMLQSVLPSWEAEVLTIGGREHLFIYFFIYLITYLFIYLFIYLITYLFIYLFT